jgi:hypothetical protein
MDNAKLNIFGDMIMALGELLLSNTKQNHIKKSMIDLLAMCLKCLFEENNNSVIL